MALIPAVAGPAANECRMPATVIIVNSWGPDLLDKQHVLWHNDAHQRTGCRHVRKSLCPAVLCPHLNGINGRR